MKRNMYRAVITFYQEDPNEDDPIGWDWQELLGTSMPVVCESTEVIGIIEACDNCGHVKDEEQVETYFCDYCRANIGPIDGGQYSRHDLGCIYRPGL